MRVSSFDAVPVAVLGASGFLGSRLTTRLLELGARVTALSRGAASSLVVPTGAAFVQGDITIAGDVSAACAGATIVFYMAGRSGAAASLRHPHDDLATNLFGLLNVLAFAAAREHRPKIVFPSSRLVYGGAEHLPVREDAALCPTSPYALNKRFSEEYLRLYHRSFGIPYAIARLTNPYGPSPALAWNGYNVVNGMIARALKGSELVIYGDGMQLRDYVFVDDAVDALLVLASTDRDALTVNVGSGRGVRLRDAAETIVGLAGAGRIAHAPWPEAARSVETGDFVADVSALETFGWKPATPFDEGLRRTIEAARR